MNNLNLNLPEQNTQGAIIMAKSAFISSVCLNIKSVYIRTADGYYLSGNDQRIYKNGEPYPTDFGSIVGWASYLFDKYIFPEITNIQNFDNHDEK